MESRRRIALQYLRSWFFFDFGLITLDVISVGTEWRAAGREQNRLIDLIGEISIGFYLDSCFLCFFPLLCFSIFSVFPLLCLFLFLCFSVYRASFFSAYCLASSFSASSLLFLSLWFSFLLLYFSSFLPLRLSICSFLSAMRFLILLLCFILLP